MPEGCAGAHPEFLGQGGGGERGDAAFADDLEGRIGDFDLPGGEERGGVGHGLDCK